MLAMAKDISLRTELTLTPKIAKTAPCKTKLGDVIHLDRR